MKLPGGEHTLQQLSFDSPPSWAVDEPVPHRRGVERRSSQRGGNLLEDEFEELMG
jgi:hypothetical protein